MTGGSLVKIGSGTFTLTGTGNSYSGGTSISSGVLSFANGALGSAGTVAFAGNATLQWYGNNTQDISSRLKIDDGVTATIDTNGNNVTFGSTLPDRHRRQRRPGQDRRGHAHPQCREYL